MRHSAARPAALAPWIAVALVQCAPAHTPRHEPLPRPPTTSIATHGPSARAHRAEGPDDLAQGPNVAGRVGDVVLENAYVRAVVDDVRGGGGFALSGGQLLDLCLRDRCVDEIGQLFNYLGRFPRQLRYRTLRTEQRPDGVAAVIVTGDEPRTPGLFGETVYSLGPDDRAVRIETTLRNEGSAPVEVGLGDAIQWAGAEHWAPGTGFALRGETSEAYIAGVGAHVTYAVVGESGNGLSGPNGGNWSNPMQAQHVSLAAGARVSYARRLGVARGGDVEGAATAAGYVKPSQSVHVRVTDASGTGIEGVRIVLHAIAGGAPAGMGGTDAHGETDIALAPGSYGVELVAAGRAPDARSTAAIAQPIVLTDRAHPTLTIALGALTALEVHATEGGQAVPVRVLVYGTEGTPDPFFGAIGRANGARNSFVAWNGEPASVPLAPGHYRVVATRGPEYALAERVIEATPGERTRVDLAMQRVVDTTGYVCGDFHSHQAPSLDSPVSLRDRARAAAAEGLEVVATTDHNVATDLGPTVAAEGLLPFLLPITGDEISTDVALAPSGHWNLYPVPVHPDQPLGGAPNLFELSPAALVARAREVAPGAVVQVNHPRSGVPTGMFDVVGFDRATARATRGEMTPTMDAIEVWNGRFQPQAEVVMLDWLAMLRAGARITATANSDSHAIVVQEVGWPRTCVRVADDHVGAFSTADVVRGIREARDAILTDGPFVRVETADGRSAIGRTISAADRSRPLRVRITSPRWSAADTVEMIHADGHFEPLNATFQTAGDIVRADISVRVPRNEPFVLFRARGSVRVSVLVDDPPLLPLAITNPVYLAPVASRTVH